MTHGNGASVRPEPLTGYHNCPDCGRLFYLYRGHRVTGPPTCRNVMGRGRLGECRGAR